MTKKVCLHIGIDDTDSKEGMCTTYIGACLYFKLNSMGLKPADYPHLIRLNPNCPYKTRGNAAIALRFYCDEDMVEQVKEVVIKTVKNMSEMGKEGTDPGIAFLMSKKVPSMLRLFSERVVREIVTVKEASSVAHSSKVDVYGFKEGRGIVGALAAIGETLDGPHTYELLAYREKSMWGKPRMVDRNSVFRMDEATYPFTFDNVDRDSGEIRITPHTPCPVLLGIRAVTPEWAKKAYMMVKVLEPVSMHIIYKTNQATDSHIVCKRVNELVPNISVKVTGLVSEEPRIIKGGHVFFKISDGTGEVQCAAYEPTRSFRNVVMSLRMGDLISVYGSVKIRENLPLTINLEKMEVHDISKQYVKVNPLCHNCGNRMKSEGKGKGYSCSRCKTKLPVVSSQLVEVKRKLRPGCYEVPPRARRHLSMPSIISDFLIADY